MTRARSGVFGMLVVATFAAFFVAQRLKRTPPDVQRTRATKLFSPNGDGTNDVARVSFRLKRADRITVRVVNADGDTVRTLASDREVPALQRVHLTWDGRTGAGARAPDGRYSYRVNLIRQGRSVLIPHSTRLDTRPPRPLVTGVGTASEGPQILPLAGGGPVTIRFRTPRRRQPAEVRIYRTSPDPKLVATLPAAKGARQVTWNGRGAPPGTYVAAVVTHDRAGTTGSSPRVLPPDPPYAARLPGHGGITVRHLAVQPPLTPVVAGGRATFGVDSRGAPYRWILRRAGDSHVVAKGRRARAALRIAAPRGPSGLYLLRVRTRRHETRVPFVVQSARRHHILVVLPAILWQGLNPVDDDGDGWPNTLADGLPVRRERVLARGLPADVVRRVAPLLAFLDREELRYDITTDLALAAGTGPPLAGHSGVILAGDERWLTADAQKRLADYVRRGRGVATFGVDSLRRQVRLTPETIEDPTAAARTDAFGATLGPLRRTKAGITITNLTDEIQLFAGNVVGGTGQFSGYHAYQPVQSAGPGAKIVASAVTEDGQKVIVAERLGRGLLIRLGLPELPRRLARPGNETELVRRTWTLLSR